MWARARGLGNYARRGKISQAETVLGESAALTPETPSSAEVNLFVYRFTDLSLASQLIRVVGDAFDIICVSSSVRGSSAMQTGSYTIQGGPTHYRQHHTRHHRAAPAQVGPASSGRLHLGNLPSQHHDSTATSISVNFRLTSAERPLAFRNGLEQAYSAGIGGPHNRRSVHPVITSLTALPASLPMPTGEDRETKALKPLPRAVENVADDPSLHNPLARQERLSTGWFGVSLLPSSGSF